MRILLSLVGVVLAAIFLFYMAIYLNDWPLYVVCLLGIALMLVAFWQDEMQNGTKAARGDGGGEEPI
ncbi:MAG TPA: hypothetical protein VJL84_00750 [Kiloniellales bacterium]|nr:hypothetical protein [Kiloniellales bacterium]